MPALHSEHAYLKISYFRLWTLHMRAKPAAGFAGTTARTGWGLAREDWEMQMIGLGQLLSYCYQLLNVKLFPVVSVRTRRTSFGASSDFRYGLNTFVDPGTSF